MSPSLATPRRQYAKTAGRIERILDVALELFATGGYRATTMKEIAERAGLSQPGLMHHFPTKADVLIALLHNRDEASSALRPEASEESPRERLLMVADDMRRQRDLVALYTVVSAEAIAPDHPAHAFFQRRYAEVVTTATAAFTLWQQQGGMRADADPALLARMMIGLLDGLQLQWLHNPDSVDLRAELGAFLDLCTP